MKTYLSGLLLLVATTFIYSQNTIKGNVKTIDTNQGIAYANIYIPKLEKGTITDENGNFNLKNLPNGQHILVCSIIGYETQSLTINLPSDTSIDVLLDPSVFKMDEIILSTPFHKLQNDNVMKVEQRKLADLKSNGIINLSEGISSIAGVESISTGISIGKPVIRGLSSNRVLVYTQGIRLENQQFGDEHGLGVNAAGIESIEVIKGPASLLYGSDALGGVLYLNPERFANSNTSSGDINFTYFTNTEGYNTNIGFKSSSDKFRFIFRGSLTEHSDYKTEDYRVTNTRFREQDFKAAIGYNDTNFTTELRYNLNASQLGIPEEIGVQSLDKTPLLPNQNINNHVFSSKSKLFFDNSSSLELNLGFTYNDRKEFEEHHHEEEHHDDEEDDHDEDEDDHDEDEETHEDEDAALHMKLKTFSYDLKYNLPTLGKFETIIGIQGMSQKNSNYGAEELIPDATTNDLGVFATSHIHFETIDIQIGARYDTRSLEINNKISKSYNSFNGAIGAKKEFGKYITARLNIASGFRAPNLAELTSNGSHHGTNRYEIGNINLKNEQNFQIDASLEYQTKHIDIFANGFYNSINNYIFLSPNGEIIDENPVYLYSQDDAQLYGGEFGMHLHPHPLDWLHIESSFEMVVGKQNNDDAYLPLIPANKLANTLRVEFEKLPIQNNYAFLKFQTYFNQSNVSDFETETDGYSLLSAGIGGDIKLFKKTLSISVSGNNLTNKSYINHLSRLKTDNINNIGRNISFGLSYKL